MAEQNQRFYAFTSENKFGQIGSITFIACLFLAGFRNSASKIKYDEGNSIGLKKIRIFKQIELGQLGTVGRTSAWQLAKQVPFSFINKIPPNSTSAHNQKLATPNC